LVTGVHGYHANGIDHQHRARGSGILKKPARKWCHNYSERPEAVKHICGGKLEPNPDAVDALDWQNG